ncbi:hypothetical protein D3C71_451310 [compost metagenome]
MKLIAVLLLTFCSFSISRAQCDADVREAFGGVSSITVYNTYITVGAIADAFVNDVYNSERVVELMKEQVNMLQTVIDMLSKCREVKSNGLTGDDVLYIQDLMDCMASLKKEAQALSDYSVAKSEEAQNRYNVNRDKAWSQISTLLGLNK